MLFIHKKSGSRALLEMKEPAGTLEFPCVRVDEAGSHWEFACHLLKTQVMFVSQKIILTTRLVCRMRFSSAYSRKVCGILAVSSNLILAP